ncbi:hypothetical protein LN458_08100 [Xanthomonas arboricola]|uniref:hypothetical protein n=1 Tax=Xanthomonas arboricola TaxID=56448 RepID=UPI001E467251|nr:hypothetical protein [Xanthomonas arboricola]MCC8473949.1 hypothetical protein [Xanthomonas arboricola]
MFKAEYVLKISFRDWQSIKRSSCFARSSRRAHDLPVALRVRMAPHICNTYDALPAATAVAQRTGSAALIKLSGDAGSYAACGMATAHNLGGL